MAINPAIMPYQYNTTKQQTTKKANTNKATTTSTPSVAQSTYDYIKKNQPKKAGVYDPEFTPGQTYDMSRYSDAIGNAPTRIKAPQPTTQQYFKIPGLQDAINQAQQAGGNPIQIDPAKWQNTEQFQQILNQMNEATKPLVQAQQQAATSGYNNALQKLQNQWASRGLGASGAAAAQEMQGAQGLAQQLALLEAQQQASNISNALNLGQLGLQESAQRFAQQANNRDFDYNRAQQNVENIRNALAMQEAMRQFEQQFGLDVERLNAAERQNYLANLANLTQMGMTDNQWAQQFGADRQDAAFNRWATTQQINNQNRNNWLSQLLAAAGQVSDDNYRQGDLASRLATLMLLS